MKLIKYKVTFRRMDGISNVPIHDTTIVTAQSKYDALREFDHSIFKGLYVEDIEEID